MTLRLNGSTSGYTEIDAPAVAGSNTIVLPSGNGSANQLLKNGSTAGSLEFSSSVYIDSSQRLLVGTSSSSDQALLTVQGYVGASTGAGVLQVRRGSNATAADTDLGIIWFGDGLGKERAAIAATSDGAGGSGDLPTRLVFSTTADGASSPTERMRIDNRGRVEVTCVNDNNAAFNVFHNGSSGSQYGIAVATPNDQNNTTNYFFTCSGGATTRAVIRSNGGLANYSANNVNLSDRNVKKDIAPVSDTWDCLKEWEIVNFRYKDQPDDADLNMGVIAQQVAESCPEVITVFQEAKEATETEPAQEERIGVKEQQMMWMAIKALQEAQVRIETLETEVAALKAS